MNRVRVASHVHSEWSYDGSWSLRRIAAGFGQRGYDAVLMAEHDRGFDQGRWSDYRQACAEASTGRTRLIPGIEYSDADNSVHVATWGDIPFLGEGIETEKLLPRADRAGGLAVLAHPGRRQVLDNFDPALFRHLAGLELWNRKYDGYAPNGAAATVLREQPGLVAWVSLDFHTARQFHPLAMILELDGEVDEDTVCEAIRRRRARGTAFGVPAEGLVEGFAWRAMSGFERARRGTRRRLRPIRRLRASRVSRPPVPRDPERSLR